MRTGVWLAMVMALLLAPGAAAEPSSGDAPQDPAVEGGEDLTMWSATVSHGFRRLHTAWGHPTPLLIFYRAGSRLWYVEEPPEDAPEPAGVPRRLAAVARSGPASARIYAHRQVTGPADELAEWLALGAEAAMELVWPGEADRVEFRVRLINFGEPVQRAHLRVRSPRGPWRLTYYHLAMLGDAESRYTIAYINLHELYHFMSMRRGLGVRDPRARMHRTQSRFVEEVAANLFATCGLLAATGEARLHLYAGRTVRVGGRDFTQPLRAEDLRYLLDVVHAGRTHDGSTPEGRMGSLIYDSLLAFASGGEQVIHSGTPQAERLLDMCRRVCADPFELDPLLRELTADGRSVPEFAPAEEDAESAPENEAA